MGQQGKKKKVISRKKRLLHRGIVLAVLLIFVIGLNGYGFTPRNGIRGNEESAHTGPTEVVFDLGKLPLAHTGLNRAYLCANENALLFSLTRFHLAYGWQDYGMCSLDCSGGENFYAGTYRISKMVKEGEEPQWIWYLFGRMEVPEAARLWLQVGYEEENKKGERSWVAMEELSLPDTEWLQKDGHTYFLSQLPQYDMEAVDWPVKVHVIVLNGNDEILHELRVESAGGTSLG